MEKIGLIAGNGKLPYFFISSAEIKGYEVFPIGLFETVYNEIKTHKNYVKINIGELGKLLSYLILNDIKKIIMLGKVEKSLIFKELKLDEIFQTLIMELPDRKDETIVFGVMSILKKNDIEILPQNFLMDYFLAEEKLYTESDVNGEKEKNTIKIGVEAAKSLAKVDVGQTVVCKNQAVVALEAVEGTDKTIERAGEYAGRDCIIVKMSRPHQDMRVDVPAIGIKTMEKAVEIGARGIVIEAKKVLFLDQEEVIKLANENGMFIKGITI